MFLFLTRFPLENERKRTKTYKVAVELQDYIDATEDLETDGGSRSGVRVFVFVFTLYRLRYFFLNR